MSQILASKKIKAVLIILGGIAVLFAVFGFGIAVGYRKAMYAARWGENYSQNFYGPMPQGPLGMITEPAPWNAHGVAGTIIDIASGTLSVKDIQNDERSVVIIPETLIRALDGTVEESDLEVGETVTAIGEPNEQGQLVARFIRVVPANVLPSMPSSAAQ